MAQLRAQPKQSLAVLRRQNAPVAERFSSKQFDLEFEESI